MILLRRRPLPPRRRGRDSQPNPVGTTGRSILLYPRSPRLPTRPPQPSLTTLGQTLPQPPPPAGPPPLLTPVAPAPMAAAMERAGTMVATMAAARLAVLPARAAVALGARAQADWARLGRAGKAKALAAQGEARGIFLVKVARGRPRGVARVTRAPRARVHHRMATQVQVRRQANGAGTQGATPSEVAYRVARTLPGRSLAFWLPPPRWRAHL